MVSGILRKIIKGALLIMAGLLFTLFFIITVYFAWELRVTRGF